MAQSLLLDLPLELRLLIYRELILTCIEKDTTYEILELLLTCRQIHQEMEDDYVSKARSARHIHTCVLWADLVYWGRRWYRLHLPEDMELRAIPAPENLRPVHQNDTSNSESEEYPTACFRCVFDLPHPPDVFHHSYDTNGGDLEFRNVGTLMGYADTSMLEHDVSPERVIFQCHAREGSDLGNLDDVDFGPLHMDWVRSNNHNEEFPFFQRRTPECSRSWRAKTVDGKNVTWSFGFDYAEGLPEFPGMVYD